MNVHSSGTKEREGLVPIQLIPLMADFLNEFSIRVLTLPEILHLGHSSATATLKPKL